MNKNKKNFLEDLSIEKEKKEFLSSVSSNIDNIAEERNKIGDKIIFLLQKNYTKKDILKTLNTETFLTNIELTNLIFEASFHEEFKINKKLNSSQIKIVQQLFKKKQYNFKQKIELLNDSKLTSILKNFQKENEGSEIENIFNHAIKFNDEGEALFDNVKKFLSKQLDKKVNNSEAIFYALIEFCSSYPEALEEEEK